ncbi:hypothetical protein GCM10009631_09610 [Corynebacterium glaucum]
MAVSIARPTITGADALVTIIVVMPSAAGTEKRAREFRVFQSQRGSSGRGKVLTGLTIFDVADTTLVPTGSKCPFEAGRWRVGVVS